MERDVTTWLRHLIMSLQDKSHLHGAILCYNPAKNN
jgi:hypothetical protein